MAKTRRNEEESAAAAEQLQQEHDAGVAVTEETRPDDASTGEPLGGFDAPIGDEQPLEVMAETEAPATGEELVVLFYDGEIPHANFPVNTKADGWVTVCATKGQNTAPLTREIADVLLASGKGFSVAAE